MNNIVWCGYKTNRNGYPGEWILYLTSLNKKPKNVWNILKPHFGLMVRFFTAFGCLGNAYWTYSIQGNPNNKQINLSFLKQSGNLKLLKILEVFMNDYKDYSLENFRNFMENNDLKIEEIKFPIRPLDKRHFDKGWFGDVMGCG